jgi:ABC-type glycerol-3-phosphate transport system substrate-binding protein
MQGPATSPRTSNRRRFLKASVTAGGAAALAPILWACSQPTAAPQTPQVVEKVVTQVVEKPVEVTRVVQGTPQTVTQVVTQVVEKQVTPTGGVTEAVLLADLWEIQKLTPAAAVAVYNTQNQGKVKVTLQETVEGWDTKALEMVRQGTIPWNGHIYDSTWIDLWKFYKTGLIQPLDDYIKGSSVPWVKDFGQIADKYWAPNIWTSGMIAGKQYQIPVNAYTTVIGYYGDMLKQVDYDAPPDTWDDFTAMAQKIKTKFADKKVVPIAFSIDWERTPGSVFATFTDKPYDDQGMTRINSPEMADAMNLMRGWVKDGLVSVEMLGDKSPSYEYWQRQRSALSIDAQDWVKAAQRIWGERAAQGTNMPVPKKGMPSRTWVTVDGAVLFNKAPHPQETTDFLLSMLGPEGPAAEAWFQGEVAYEGAPEFPAIFDKLVKEGDPNFWVRKTFDMLKNSTPAPLNGSQGIMLFNSKPFVEKILKGEVPVQQGLKDWDDGIKAAMDKFNKGIGA